jgi:hypothetical protein
MLRADDVMDTLYSALIDMGEMGRNKDEEIVFSEFSKEIITSISSIKLKKIMSVHETTKPKDTAIIVENNSCIKKKEISLKTKTSLKTVTFNCLSQELRVLFKDTDIVEVIIEALINIKCIDSSGCRSEKANLLLNTIISNKVKSLIIKKTNVEIFK